MTASRTGRTTVWMKAGSVPTKKEFAGQCTVQVVYGEGTGNCATNGAVGR